MQKQIEDLLQSVKETGAHIFYTFENEEKYVDNLIVYITAAIGIGNHIMIIENDRIMPEIQKRIQAEFGEEQQEMIHTINNYDFYCYRGNFHKETILSYLENMIAPFLQNNIPIQTWAHVEWRDQKEIFQNLGEYEKEADLMLQATNLITICGYDSKRVPDSLKETLLVCHDYYMTDDTVEQINRKSRI
ncbi:MULTISPECIES: MEDS domain-containing protein [unclassified Bacillus (in: firmicutes)]|uniref:MEDS domain-containing protein n=1 Tax=unclassified Bacillus (in: firmicutes) TaxID=185979 RepID=UPI001BE7D4D8|nr:MULTISPECIES: MEDS domain-containing protein [unclassified Bacillus (in: firmicutes)]MBT2638257.1 MEDS domain-containing protein [Bacillus sp. ISL-39]MBT2661387.1 MEDS domain-containing protein [Bacillus sp. ISL-45]